MKEKLRVSLPSWGREAVEAQGRLRTTPGSPASRARALGLQELQPWLGAGETLGPFPTLVEALAAGEVRA